VLFAREGVGLYIRRGECVVLYLLYSYYLGVWMVPFYPISYALLCLLLKRYLVNS
jgi:hypothetical protein